MARRGGKERRRSGQNRERGRKGCTTGTCNAPTRTQSQHGSRAVICYRNGHADEEKKRKGRKETQKKKSNKTERHTSTETHARTRTESKRENHDTIGVIRTVALEFPL